MYSLLLLFVSGLALLWQPAIGEAQVRLENPAPGSSQSGLGLISGFICQANRVEIEIDGRATFEAAYGTARSDTQGVCGDINNGFGLLFNWNLAGDGTNHRVRVLADGVEVATSTFAVTTLGLGQFPEGLNGTGTITNFPQSGRSTQLQWQESLQNFSIMNPSGNSNGDGSNSPGVRLENPAPGSSQSGLGLISGFICQANRVEIEIDGRATFEAAYGTARSDTQGVCGDINNGFGLLFNWNLAGDGTNHRVRVLADGVEVATSTFAVTTLGLGQFPEGLNGTGTITNFPQSGRSTQLQWQESLQNFSIAQVSPGGAQLTTSGTPLDFGNVTILQSRDLDFIVTNSGGGTLTGSVSVSAPFSIVSGGTLNVGAGQSQTVTVRFSPTSVGPVSGTAAISSNGGSGSVAVSGVGVPPEGPQIVINPATLNFGNVTIGQSSNQTFTVTNGGGGTLTGTASTTTPFSIVSGGTINLGAGQTQTVTVSFNPTSLGQFSGTAAISSNGGSATVVVSGVGEEGPQVVVSPSGISFDDTPVGQSTTKTFNIINDGGGTLTGSVSAPAPFSIVSGSPFSVGAGQSQTVTVRFSPTSEDFFSDFATVTSNAGSAQVTLSGTGTDLPPQCEVSPTALDFGDVESGKTKDLSFTITNSGGGVLNGDASIDSNSPSFAIVSGASFNLGSGQSQAVVVRFTASAFIGGASSSVTVFSSDESIFCSSVSLYGVGVCPPGQVCAL